MKAITDIGQAFIRAGERDVFLNPSFLGMSRIGSAEEIVDTFVKVHGGKYPSHRMNSGPVSKVVYATCFAEMAEAAARVIQACSEQDVTGIIGQYRVTTSGRLIYRPGAIPIDDVITIARHLMNHGVMGDQPAEEAQRRDGDYSDKFEPRSFVYTAVAHLGMSESDAWDMTMTSFRAAMDAKFPQKARVKIPSQERYDEAMDWAEKMMTIDAQRHGPH